MLARAFRDEARAILEGCYTQKARRVAKLGPAGNTLVYSTYLVGATANGIAVDAAGNAYVAVPTASSR